MMTEQTRYLTDEQLGQFWQDGYIVLKNTLDPDVIAKSRDAILDMIPRDLILPDYYHAHHGRLKPHHPDRNHSMFTPELLPLLQNAALYRAAADIMETEYVKVGDGSVGVTIKNTGIDGRIQNLHLDVRPRSREEATPEFFRTGIGVGGCYYLSRVEENGGGIHVVPGGPNMTREVMLSQPNGLEQNSTWGDIVDFPPSIEVTGEAGDFVLMHHLMPHAASTNRRNIPRIVQFTRLYPLSKEEARQTPGPGRDMTEEALATLTPLGRKLFRIDPWVA
ncbi:uncharacterized protein METZ01_LOCUS316286 [marine metagenome]|uniref:Phytanoyl-CoA dioxygenase n=1 Tax=marine metagenome TaxID=408172 RepID=A0A382NUQ2_9ZZZZ